MSNLPRTPAEITNAVFHGGINQGNRSAGMEPVYTSLQVMTPEEATRRLKRIIARAKFEEMKQLLKTLTDNYEDDSWAAAQVKQRMLDLDVEIKKKVVK